VPDTFDWSNQVVESLWWIAWVFVVTTVGFAVVVGCCCVSHPGDGRSPGLRCRTSHPGRPGSAGDRSSPFFYCCYSRSWRSGSTSCSLSEQRPVHGATRTQRASFTTYLEIFGVIATIHRDPVECSPTTSPTCSCSIGESDSNERLVDDWIDGQAFYRGQYVNEPIDNPEQRIQEDITSLHDELAELAIARQTRWCPWSRFRSSFGNSRHR